MNKWSPEAIRAESEALPVRPLRVTRRPYRYRVCGVKVFAQDARGLRGPFEIDGGETLDSCVQIERRAFAAATREIFGATIEESE